MLAGITESHWPIARKVFRRGLIATERPRVPKASADQQNGACGQNPMDDEGPGRSSTRRKKLGRATRIRRRRITASFSCFRNRIATRVNRGQYSKLRKLDKECASP
jgi:hypothetical protein